MKLDKAIHRRIMLRILSDISSDPFLAINLGFKGGTCCYFLHGLDRFSVDLDFDCLDKTKDNEIRERLLNLLEKYGTIKTKQSIKLKYDDEYQSLKIDLSTKYEINKLNTYEIQNIVSGIPLKVLKKEDIFAHKLVTLTDRNIKGDLFANRDLYDVYFFLTKMWKFNKEIILLRTNKKAKQYLQYVIRLIDKKVNESNILERIGALVDDKKRNWIRRNLKRELLRLLSIEAF